MSRSGTGMLRAAFLAVALLAAQHAAYAHALWHANSAGLPDQSQLCDFDGALGNILGTLDHAAPLPCAFGAARERIGFVRIAAPAPAAPTPTSRGPPAVL
jgi:hypothetical protein